MNTPKQPKSYSHSSGNPDRTHTQRKGPSGPSAFFEAKIFPHWDRFSILPATRMCARSVLHAELVRGKTPFKPPFRLRLEQPRTGFRQRPDLAHRMAATCSGVAARTRSHSRALRAEGLFGKRAYPLAAEATRSTSAHSYASRS